VAHTPSGWTGYGPYIRPVGTGGDFIVGASVSDPTYGDMSLMVAKCLSSGALDTTFGSGGVAVSAAPISGGTDGTLGFAVDSSGAIYGGLLVIASSDDAALITRFTSSGDVDSGFGTGGWLQAGTSLQSMSDGFGNTIAVADDDRLIVATAEIDSLVETAEFKLTWYDSSGTVDTSSSVEVGDYFAAVEFIAIGSSDEIYVAGTTDNSTGAVTVARFSSAGNLDTDFGSGGTITHETGGYGITGLQPLANDEVALSYGSWERSVWRFSASSATELMTDQPESILGMSSNGAAPLLINPIADHLAFGEFLDDETVTVYNVAPQATVEVDNGDTGNLGGVSLVDPTDPSFADTDAGFRYSFALSQGALVSYYSSASTSNFKSYEDLGVTGAGPYTIYGRIFDADGGYQDYSSVLGALPTVDVQSPTTPNSITMTWHDIVSGEDGWRVQRSSDGTHFNWYKNLTDLVPDGNGNFLWQDTSLPEETRFYYRIRAYGGSVDTGYSPKDSGLTMLKAPTSPRAESVSFSKVKVSWADQSNIETGYEVYRSATGTPNSWTLATTTAANATSFTDTGLSGDQTYHYYVRAISSSQHSDDSAAVDAAAVLPNASNVLASNSGDDVVVTWNAPSVGDYSGFTLRMYDPDSPTTQIGSDININSGSARSYTVIDFLDPDDTAKALFSIEPNGSDGDADETAAVKNVYEPDAWATYVYEYPDEVNQADPVDYVASAWQNADHYAPGVKANEEDVDPVWDLGWASAGEYKLSLHNLPRHTWVEVNIQITANAGIGNTSVLTATAGVEVLNSHMDDDWGVQEWNVEDQIKHTDSDLDIYFSMSLPTMTTFSFDVVQVFTEIPFVSLSTSGYGTEGGTDATVTVSRQASGEMLDEPLAVDIQDSGGTASRGADYGFDGSITIPGPDDTVPGATSALETFGIVDDGLPEWTEDTSLNIEDTDQYKVTSSTPRYVDIVDDDLYLSGLPDTLQINNDDDNDNGIPDMDETAGVAGEDDLHAIYFDYPQENRPGAEISLNLPGLRAYTGSDGSGPLQSLSWTLDGSAESLPPRAFYVGAISGSAAIGDVIGFAQATDAGAQPTGRATTTTNASTNPSTASGVNITYAGAAHGSEFNAGDVYVGQHIEITATPLGPGNHAGAVYKWEIPGRKVAGWETAEDAQLKTSSGHPLAFTDDNHATVEYYWVDGGDREVVLTGSDAGNSFKGSVRFRVIRPDVTVQVMKAQPTSIDGPGGDWQIRLGKPTQNPNDAGIWLLANPNPAPNGASYNWVSLINASIAHKAPNVAQKTRTTGGDYWLDTAYDYPGVSFTDSPYWRLANDESATVSESFRTWLTYRPPGDDSIYVPLKLTEWSWGGTASILPPQLGQGYAQNGKNTDPHPKITESYDYPEWDNNWAYVVEQ
jgi:hypothetical protein